MKFISIAGLLGLMLMSASATAQQSEDFGNYVVHYNALNTNLISPQVAQEYGIRRSSSRAMINITVLKKGSDDPDTPVNAKVTAKAKNLTGQIREIEIREYADRQGAVYYIGELSVRNMETFDFMVAVLPEGVTEPMNVRFRQQFYTE